MKNIKFSTLCLTIIMSIIIIASISCAGKPTAVSNFQAIEEYNNDNSNFDDTNGFTLSQLTGKWQNNNEKLYIYIGYTNGVMYCEHDNTVLWQGDSSTFSNKKFTEFKILDVKYKDNIWQIYAVSYIFANPSNFTRILKSPRYYNGIKPHSYSK